MTNGNFIRIEENHPSNLNHNPRQIIIEDDFMSSPKLRTSSFDNNFQGAPAPWIPHNASVTSPWNEAPRSPPPRYAHEKMDIAHDFSKGSNIWSASTASGDRSITSPPWATNNSSPMSFHNHLDPMRRVDSGHSLNVDIEERKSEERKARAPWNQNSDDESFIKSSSPVDSQMEIGSPGPFQPKGNGILDAPLTPLNAPQTNLAGPPPPNVGMGSGLPRQAPRVQGKYLIEDEFGIPVEEIVMWTGVKLRKPDGRNLIGKYLNIRGPTANQMHQRKTRPAPQRKNSPNKHAPKTGNPGSAHHYANTRSAPGAGVTRVLSSSPGAQFN